jgi:hypothetical protein
MECHTIVCNTNLAFGIPKIQKTYGLGVSSPLSLLNLGLVALGTTGIGNLIKFLTPLVPPILQIRIIHTIVGSGQT